MTLQTKNSLTATVSVVVANIIIFLMAYNFSQADMLEAIFITYFSFAGILLHQLISYIWHTVTRLDTFYVAKIVVAIMIFALTLPWFGVIAFPAIVPLAGTEDAIENLSWSMIILGVVIQFFGAILHKKSKTNTRQLTLRAITTFVNIGIIFMVLTSFSMNLSIEEIRWLVVAVQLLYVSNYIANNTDYITRLIGISHSARTNIKWRNSVDPIEIIIKVIGYGLVFLPSIIIILSIV